jgi:hypothetical protein
LAGLGKRHYSGIFKSQNWINVDLGSESSWNVSPLSHCVAHVPEVDGNFSGVSFVEYILV